MVFAPVEVKILPAVDSTKFGTHLNKNGVLKIVQIIFLFVLFNEIVIEI